MWLRLKLAFRNTFRNSRRTTLNVLMIAGGVCTMLLFEGFAHRMVLGLRETTIKTQTGHLQIAKTSYWKKTAKRPKDNLLPNYRNWIQEIRKTPHVSYAAGRLTFYSLLTYGEKSLSAQGVSFDPQAEKSRQQAFKFVKGTGLNPKKKFQVAIGIGLATKLKIKPGKQVTLLGQTYDGVVNALDMEVSGIFQTAITEFDDNSFIVPLEAAQTLLDTQGVEQIVVGLDSTSSTTFVKNDLNRRLGAEVAGVQIRPWYWLATLYNQVADFNRVQNKVFKFIILSLILLSILNTIGMSIAERTGEIGTVRAMGESPWKLVFQFLLEGIILGATGAFVGAILGSLVAFGVNSMKIPIMLPGANSAYPIKIDLLWEAVKQSTLLAILASGVAALLPAIRASRLNIVESLKRFV